MEQPVLKNRKGVTTHLCCDVVAQEACLRLLYNDRLLTEFYCLPCDFTPLAVGYLYANGYFSRLDEAEFLGDAVQADDGSYLLTVTGTIAATPSFSPRTTFGHGRYDLLLPDCSAPNWSRVMAYEGALLKASAAFRETGCIHAAALFCGGALCYLGEDISRFYAMYKALGKALLAGAELSSFVLCTTGRLPYAYMQRVVRSGIRCVISRSAPTDSSLALAARHGVAVFGFARAEKATCYLPPLACCLLAGGSGSRADGADKALLTRDGKSFAAHILNAMSPTAERILSYNKDTVAICAALEHLPKDPRHSLKIMPDLHTGIGPLGGLYTVLNQCESHAVLFAPCDLPFYSSEIAAVCRKLYTGLQDAVVLTVNGRPQPLCAIYTKFCLPTIERLMAAHRYRLTDLLAELRVTYANAANFSLDEVLFTNINTMQEYKTI